MTIVSPENHEDEITHLAKEHGLTKAIAYIRSNSSKQRSSGAERTAKCRQQKKEKGFVQVYLPATVAEEIKVAGSFEAWYERFKPYPDEKIRKIKQAIETANKIHQLPRWKRWIIGL